MEKRLLGLDVGSVRIGVALSDPLGIFAQPLEVVDRRRVEPVAHLATLVADYEVCTVVVGRPTRLNGNDGPAVAAVQKFVTLFTQQVRVPVVMWDERLTTAAAQRLMIAGGVRRRSRRESIDKVAAALILQSYMDASGRVHA